MEEKDFEFALAVVDELQERLIVLAGNLNNALKVIRRDEENEKDYNRYSIAFDNDDALQSLHDLSLLRIILQNGVDDLAYNNKQAN